MILEGNFPMVLIVKVVLVVIFKLTSHADQVTGTYTVRNPEGENETLTCYDCSANETKSCNSPIRLDMTIKMVSCSTSNNEKQLRHHNPYSFHASPPYHPKESQSGSLWAEVVFKNWDPAPSPDDRFWGLPISVWLDDGSSKDEHIHTDADGMPSNSSMVRKSREADNLEREITVEHKGRDDGKNYYCYILNSEKNTLRGCSPKPMNKTSGCPVLLQIHGPGYSCSLCRWSLCNCSIGPTISLMLVFFSTFIITPCCQLFEGFFN